MEGKVKRLELAGVNSIKLLHLYFTRWTVVSTSAHKIEFNNCLYKPKCPTSSYRCSATLVECEIGTVQ